MSITRQKTDETASSLFRMKSYVTNEKQSAVRARVDYDLGQGRVSGKGVNSTCRQHFLPKRRVLALLGNVHLFRRVRLPFRWGKHEPQ